MLRILIFHRQFHLCERDIQRSQVTGAPIFIKSEIFAYLHSYCMYQFKSERNFAGNTQCGTFLDVEGHKPLVIFFKLMIMVYRRYERNSRYTTYPQYIHNLQRDTLCELVKYMFTTTVSMKNLNLTLFYRDPVHIFYRLENSAYCCFRRIKP